MDECICKCIRTDTLARYFCISYIDVYWCFCFSTCVWCCFCFLLTATVYAKVSRSLCLTECPVPLTRCILYLSLFLSTADWLAFESAPLSGEATPLKPPPKTTFACYSRYFWPPIFHPPPAENINLWLPNGQRKIKTRGMSQNENGFYVWRASG